MGQKKIRQDVYDKALEYHRLPRPGKISVEPTKAVTTASDLALAYSPGVAAPCEEIAEDPALAQEFTARGNLVAVITNGTAVLGLGAIGPLAAKPVMEGKGVLFKKFAGLDVFDIEVDETDPDKLVDIIASLEPTFGGINLEDIKSPECFIIEQKLKQRMNIPVFHDDQHGTAIITAAAMINALHIIDKKIEDVKLAASGAGAAGIACLDLLVNLGMKREHIMITDRDGVVFTGRQDLLPDDPKSQYARETDARTLAEALDGADVFLGVSAPGVLSPKMVKTMAKDPIILALANPVPEIMPELAREARPDAIIATGRSDFPNQVNNVLCFPYMFRGALDVGATGINESMKMAAVHAIAELARIEASDISAQAYGGDLPSFGRHIPNQAWIERLRDEVIAPKARQVTAVGLGRNVTGFDPSQLGDRVHCRHLHRCLLMKPMFERARAKPQRVVYAEGEEEVVLRAVQSVLDEGIARPILIARPNVLAMRLEKLGLRLDPEKDIEVVNPESDPRFFEYWTLFHQKMEREGVTPDMAKFIVRTRNSVIAALMLERDEADAMICGVVGRYQKKLQHVVDVIGLRDDVPAAAAVSVISAPKHTVFVCDTHVNPDPTADELANATLMAAELVRDFGIEPKVALVSHSDFGSHYDASAQKMRQTLQLIRERAPELEVEGEMKADIALLGVVRERVFPSSKLTGAANLLVMPDQASAHIAFSMTRVVSNAVSVGPILLGMRKPAHVLTPTATVRRVVNMTAVAVCDALRRQQQGELEV